MKGLLLGKNPMKISNVGKLSLIHIPSKVMKELIRKNPMNISNVDKTFSLLTNFQRHENLLLQLTSSKIYKNSWKEASWISNEVNLFVIPFSLRNPEMYTEEKPYECKQCEKAYNLPRSFQFTKTLIVERNHSNARNVLNLQLLKYF